MPFWLMLKTLVGSIPPSGKRVTVGVLCLVAVLWGTYLIGACQGKSVAHEQYVTDSLHAAVEASAAAAHEARVDAIVAVDTAALTRRAVRAAIAAYSAKTHIIIAQPTITADRDSVHVTYADGRDTVMRAAPEVVGLIKQLVSIGQRKDSLLSDARFILDHQVPQAVFADSVAIRKLSFALDRSDSLVMALRAQNAALATQVARLTPNGLEKALNVAKWAAVLYVGAKVVQLVRR